MRNSRFHASDFLVILKESIVHLVALYIYMLKSK